MRDELTEYLINDRHQTRISPEMLELLGKQAANQYLDDKIPLNESIAKLAGAYPGINSEQVKRVVEFANTAVYLGIHDKAKTAGAESSYPQFELADSGRIVQDLSDGASPTRLTTVDVAYGRQPEKAKLSSATVDALLSDMFGVKTAEAELDYTRESVVDDILGVKSDLTALKDHLTGAASQLDFMWKEASDQYYEKVKRHLLDGGTFTDVLAAARIPGLPQEKVAHVLRPVVTQLLKEKVASAELLKAQSNDLVKVAHRVLNEEHPLVTLFRSLLSIDDEIEKVACGLEDVDVELSRVNGFIQERLCGNG